VKSRAAIALLGLLAVLAMTWAWQQSRSVNPDAHAHIDSALRELRGLDRTINQDVLRARFQLIDDYQPVLRSYRRIEQLEATIGNPPDYLDVNAKAELTRALADYRRSITNKQNQIELFKYESADLRELLGSLPGAGAAVAKLLSESGDEALADEVTRVLELTLVYNLTSDESYAPRIREGAGALARRGEYSRSVSGRRRVRTFVLNIGRLLQVKPEVDRLLARIFDEPVITHEDRVAALYYGGYAAADARANHYRLGLYAACLLLMGLIGYGVLRLQQSARSLAISNERLEARVLERTAELDARNREMQAVFDHVDQALFTVDLSGRISRERSAALDRWFPGGKPGTLFWDLVRPFDDNIAAIIQLSWEGLSEQHLPLALLLDQLPRRLAVGAKRYQLEYRPIQDGEALERILIVISDVTQLIANAQRDAEQREQLIVFRNIMADSAGFENFLAEGERLVEQVLSRSTPANAEHARRALHTLKGNCSMYGLQSLVSTCHALETELSDGAVALSEASKHTLAQTWAAFATETRALIGSSLGERIELSRGELEELRLALSGGKSPNQLLGMLDHLAREPVERRLGRLSEQARHLARRLGKGHIAVTTEANGIRLDVERWTPFWTSFVHMIRNALDHGLEPAEERLRAGKPAVGQLTFRVTRDDLHVRVDISDDGRGIDWAAVARRADQRGLEHSTRADLSLVLFNAGLSTKESATELSGRGVGIGACYAECKALGGTLSVRSEPGRGSKFTFLIPSDDALPASVTLERPTRTRAADA
jgi:HPt (histidine-containing phosphotransfer) domain-containing protein